MYLRIYDFIEANIDKRNGSTLSLTNNSWLYADNKIVETIPRKNKINIDTLTPLTISKEGRYEFGNRIFTIKKYNDNELFIFPSSTANFAYIDLSETPFPLILRTRKDGDIITPFGMKGSMKLKKYMNGTMMKK